MDRRNFLQMVAGGMIGSLLSKVAKVKAETIIGEVIQGEVSSTEHEIYSDDAFEKWFNEGRANGDVTWYHYSYPDPRRPGKFTTTVSWTFRNVPMSHVDNCGACQESLKMFGIEGRQGAREQTGRYWERLREEFEYKGPNGQ